MDVLRVTAIVAKCARAARDGLVVGEEGTCVAIGAEVLPGVEARRRGDGNGGGPPSPSRRTLRLCGILDEHEAERGELLHRRHLAIEMHRDDRPGARPDLPSYLGDVDQEMVGVAVDQHRHGARARDGERGRDEGVDRHDDLVALPDARGTERDLERVGPVRDADAVAHVREAREGRLERLDLRAEDEAPAVEDARESARDVVRHLPVLRPQVDQRDTRHQTGSSRPAARTERWIASSACTTVSPSRPPVSGGLPAAMHSRK